MSQPVGALTFAQKRELKRLKDAEGYLSSYKTRIYKIFTEIKKKGYNIEIRDSCTINSMMFHVRLKEGK